MNIRYRVELNQTERAELTALVSGGKNAARKLKRAQILLAADAGVSDDDIVASARVSGSTVYRTKQRFVLGNLEAALAKSHALEQAVNSRAKRRPCWVNGLFQAPRGPRPLEPGIAGWRNSQAYPARRRLAGDGMAALGR